MTMTNSDDVENGAHHLPCHCFDDHEKHPSMAHNLLIASTPITEDHPYPFPPRQNLFHFNNKHQLLSKRHSLVTLDLFIDTKRYCASSQGKHHHIMSGQ